MEIKKLPAEVATLLSERIGDEYAAHYFYRHAHNYCENAGYLKAAAFFAAEAKDELKHAARLQKYLTDWNMMPELKAIAAPQSVKGLVDIIEKAYEMEKGLGEKYEKAAKTMLARFDFTTLSFLQFYLDQQQKATAEYSTFLNQLALIDKTDKNWVVEFEQHVF